MVTGRPRSFTVKLSEEEHEVLNSYARSRQSAACAGTARKDRHDGSRWAV